MRLSSTHTSRHIPLEIGIDRPVDLQQVGKGHLASDSLGWRHLHHVTYCTAPYSQTLGISIGKICAKQLGLSM
jgi:hypothetical protein